MKTQTKIEVLAALAAVSTPVAASAASFRTFVDGTVVSLGDSMVNVLYTLIFLVFLYGIFKFFFTGGEQGREKGKKFIFSGLIGIVVLFSVWGLVRLFINTLIQPGV